MIGFSLFKIEVRPGNVRPTSAQVYLYEKGGYTCIRYIG